MLRNVHSNRLFFAVTHHGDGDFSALAMVGQNAWQIGTVRNPFVVRANDNVSGFKPGFFRWTILFHGLDEDGFTVLDAKIFTQLAANALNLHSQIRRVSEYLDVHGRDSRHCWHLGHGWHRLHRPCMLRTGTDFVAVSQFDFAAHGVTITADAECDSASWRRSADEATELFSALHFASAGL